MYVLVGEFVFIYYSVHCSEQVTDSQHLFYLTVTYMYVYSHLRRVMLQKHTVPLKGKLPPLVSFLARRVSFLARRFSFLARRVSFLSRITDAFSMAYITRKKPDMCNGCCSAVRWQIDGTVQHKMCIGFISA